MYKFKQLMVSGKTRTMYFKEVNGFILQRKPGQKYKTCMLKTIPEVRRIFTRNGWKEIKPIQKLTEIQWLDKVCENFRN